MYQHQAAVGPPGALLILRGGDHSISACSPNQLSRPLCSALPLPSPGPLLPLPSRQQLHPPYLLEPKQLSFQDHVWPHRPQTSSPVQHTLAFFIVALGLLRVARPLEPVVKIKKGSTYRSCNHSWLLKGRITRRARCLRCGPAGLWPVLLVSGFCLDSLFTSWAGTPGSQPHLGKGPVRRGDVLGASSTKASQAYLSWGPPGPHYLPRGEEAPPEGRSQTRGALPHSPLHPALWDPPLWPDSSFSPSFYEIR